MSAVTLKVYNAVPWLLSVKGIRLQEITASTCLYTEKSKCFFFNSSGLIKFVFFISGPHEYWSVLNFSFLGCVICMKWFGSQGRADTAEMSEIHKLHGVYWSQGSGDQQCSFLCSANGEAMNWWPLALSGILVFVNLSGLWNDAGVANPALW